MDSNSVISSLCVFHPIWVFAGRGGWGSQGGWGTTCLCNFPVSAAQKCSSLSPLRGALPKAIDFWVLLPTTHKAHATKKYHRMQNTSSIRQKGKRSPKSKRKCVLHPHATGKERRLWYEPPIFAYQCTCLVALLPCLSPLVADQVHKHVAPSNGSSAPGPQGLLFPELFFMRGIALLHKVVLDVCCSLNTHLCTHACLIL